MYINDEIDKFILETLMKNAKTTITKFCEATGLTKAPMHNRITRAYKNYIKDVIAIVDRKKLGYNLECIAIISLKEQTNESFDNFLCYLHNCKFIRSAELLTGNSDYLIRFVCKDYDHMTDIISFIRQSPLLLKLQVFNILEQSLFKPGVPLE